MKATVTKFNKYENKGMLGFVDFVIAATPDSDAFIKVEGAKLMQSTNGMWLAMPSHNDKKDKDGNLVWKNDITIYTSSKDKQNPDGDAFVEDIISQCRIKMSGGNTAAASPKKQPTAPKSQAPMDEDIPF